MALIEQSHFPDEPRSSASSSRDSLAPVFHPTPAAGVGEVETQLAQGARLRRPAQRSTAGVDRDHTRPIDAHVALARCQADGGGCVLLVQ
jgi:hypothetical protein